MSFSGRPYNRPLQTDLPGFLVGEVSVSVPSAEFPTVTAAVDWARSRPRAADAKVVVNIAEGKYDESFSWRDCDLSFIELRGAEPDVVNVTGTPVLSGSARAYSVAVPVSGSMRMIGGRPSLTGDIARFSVGDIVTLDPTGAPSTPINAIVHGTGVVTAINSSSQPMTVTVSNRTEGTFTGALTYTPCRLVLWKTVFRRDGTYREHAYAADGWMRLERAASPVLADIAVEATGTALGEDLGNKVNGIAARSGSRVTIANDGTSRLRFATVGFYVGVFLFRRSLLIGGALSCSQARYGGIYANGSDAAPVRVLATGNGQGLKVAYGGNIQLGISEGEEGISLAAGNQEGIVAESVSTASMWSGCARGNNRDVYAIQQGRMYLGQGGGFTYGTASPAVNTVGNVNSYIQRA